MDHGDGFGGDWRGSPHGWLLLLGSAFSMGFYFLNFFLIWVFVPVGFWWAVVAWWAWWRRGGGDWAVEAQ